MRRLSFLIALSAIAVMASGPGVATVSAQTTIPVADAQAFLGEWAVALDAQGQTFTMDVRIHDESGNAAAEVSSEMGGPTKVETISRDGENLVLSYSMEAQGQTVPVVMTLVPEAAGWNVNVDFADGMFETSGKGTRK